MGVIFTNHCTVTAQLKGPPEVFEEDCDKLNPPRHFVARFDEISNWNRGVVGYSTVVPINPKNAVLLK